MQVWNLENMLPIQALQRHERAVHSMVVWHDTVFTGSEDMEIKVSTFAAEPLLCHLMCTIILQVFKHFKL